MSETNREADLSEIHHAREDTKVYRPAEPRT